jgi:hypothetical protein
MIDTVSFGNLLFKICGNLTYANAACPAGSSVCAYNRIPSALAAGLSATQLHRPSPRLPPAYGAIQLAQTLNWTIARTDDGAQMYGTSSICNPRANCSCSATINFICDPAATTPFLTTTISGPGPCFDTYIRMATAVACGTNATTTLHASQ